MSQGPKKSTIRAWLENVIVGSGVLLRERPKSYAKPLADSARRGPKFTCVVVPARLTCCLMHGSRPVWGMIAADGRFLGYAGSHDAATELVVESLVAEMKVVSA